MKSLTIVATCLLLVFSSVSANESPKALQDAFMAALRANDAAGLAACYSEDAVNFTVDSMMIIGPESIRQSWEEFFSTYQVMEASVAHDHLEVHGDTAVSWGLFKLMAKPVEGGEPVEMSGRYMDVARNFDGNWLYVADHASMPLPEADQAEESSE